MIPIEWAEWVKQNKLVLSAQTIVPGYLEPAHFLRWGRSGLTICGERAAKKADISKAIHVCQKCWDTVQWSANKTPRTCWRCGVEFPYWEKDKTVCGYCEHVWVSQFGAHV